MAGESGNDVKGESAGGMGDSKQEQAAQKSREGSGSRGVGSQTSAELKNKISGQMERLSAKMSDLEKEMGIDIDENKEGNTEKGKSLKELNTLKPEDVETMGNGQSKEAEKNMDDVASPGGDKPGEKLYSSEPEKIETSESDERMDVKIEGSLDERGTARETISIGEGKPAATRRKLPTVGYDDKVELSKEQAEDDAIRKTSIPLEYEDIIKDIHSDKE
jgi:hypothetical protein